MKILHFVHNFPPEFRGGTEMYVLNLSLRQARTGHQVHVVSGSAAEGSGVDYRSELSESIRVTRLLKGRRDGAYKIWPHYPRISREALRLMRDFRPDLVHVHHWHHLSDDLVRTAVRDRFPVVLTLHDFFSVCPRFFRVRPGANVLCPSEQSPGECFTCIRKEHFPWPAELAAELYRRRKSMFDEAAAATFVYTFSGTVADFFGSIPWFPHVPIAVLPIGLLYPLARSKFQDRGQPLKVATWGGQAEVKGTDLLLQAAARPSLKGKIEVHVLGRMVNEAYRDRLQVLAGKCGAVLHGFFPESEKGTLGNRFDLAVFPTRAFETYSIVVDEALSMGMPVITTRPGAQCERVGEAGLIVSAGDVEGLTAALEAMLDPEVRRRAAAATKGVKVGTLDKHWMDLSGVYTRLVRASGRYRQWPPGRKLLRRVQGLPGSARPGYAF